MIVVDGFWTGFVMGFLFFAFVLMCYGLYNTYKIEQRKDELQEKLCKILAEQGIELNEEGEE